jgi:hypothetical protein
MGGFAVVPEYNEFAQVARLFIIGARQAIVEQFVIVERNKKSPRAAARGL